MYIKLTRLDNSPIWLNAAFIVTIEPRKQGGATVVPIGDGLDYDVKESPEQVLRILEDLPPPPVAVVPVPQPKSLTKTPDDVSPEPEVRHDTPKVVKPIEGVEPKERAEEFADANSVEAPEPSKARRTTKARTRTTKTTRAKAAAVAAAGEKSADKPASADAEAVKEVPSDEPVVKTSDETAPSVSEGGATLSDDMIARLRRMAPRSVKKLLNTLSSQFRLVAPQGALDELVRRGVLTLERDHVNWQA